MSFVKVKHFPSRNGQPARTYYYEVESYRTPEGKVKHRTLRYLGKELPKDLPYTIGYAGTKLREGKRVEVRKTSLVTMEFLNETGTIKKLRRKYALVEFDDPIRGRKEWLIAFDRLGNIPKGQVENH
ncbi:hypothetical protein ES703_52420 [subsurface metagenome]